MNETTRPISAEIREQYDGHISRDPNGNAWSLIFGPRAERASVTVEQAPYGLALEVMRGDLDAARDTAQRIALARDALPTRAERGAVSYSERLVRTFA